MFVIVCGLMHWQRNEGLHLYTVADSGGAQGAHAPPSRGCVLNSALRALYYIVLYSCAPPLPS